MKCDSKLEANMDQFIAKVEYGSRAPGLQCWYCDVLPGNLNRERNIRSRAIYDITHCAFSLEFKKKIKGQHYAHSSLHISISYLRQILQHLLNFFLFFCDHHDSVLQLLLLVTWIPEDHRIPKHSAITARLYSVYIIQIVQCTIKSIIRLYFGIVGIFL